MAGARRSRRKPCDVVPDAERAALEAAVAAAGRRGALSSAVRMRPPLPWLLVQDTVMATWLISDGRARRAGRGQARLLLTPVLLAGLSALDARDAVVLDAYLAAFASVLTAAGYPARIEKP
jgi:hypothetical protein